MFTFDTYNSQRMCGHELPLPIVTKSSKIEIVFHSDPVVPAKGFVIKIYFETGTHTYIFHIHGSAVRSLKLLNFNKWKLIQLALLCGCNDLSLTTKCYNR